MSIDLNWDTLTSGPDGIQLAEDIRAFIHDKFQAVTLPRFIQAVNVHDFEFGDIAPSLELKDICDPLPEFYEENGDGEEEEDSEADGDDRASQTAAVDREAHSLRERRRTERATRPHDPSQIFNRPPHIDTRLSGIRASQVLNTVGSPFLGVNTPGIPGGTSNLSYFHSHLASGLSGTQTPLAAVAGAHFTHGWPDHSVLPAANRPPEHHHSASVSSLSPPSTADPSAYHMLRERESVSTLAPSTSTMPAEAHDAFAEGALAEEEFPPPKTFHEPRTEDLQTVLRMQYSGNIKLSLTAMILLDYPMPSFVGIPVKLNITGLTFDGVAVLAYIRKRAHFCFLSPEDAHAALGPDDVGHHEGRNTKLGGLLQEIKVESEIGQRENGKQVLKNVGKVEKFVLEQVRRIFEDEFVYPSFWTFLV